MLGSRRFLSIAVALSVLSAISGAASAATSARALGVRMTIVASCIITTPDSIDGLAAPGEAANVDCSHATPFTIVADPIVRLSEATADQPAMMTVVY